MQAAELRPMGIGDILDTTFHLYRKKFVPFMVIVLVAYVPYSLIIGAVISAGVQAEGEPPDPAALLGLSLMTLLFAAVVIPLCQGALVHNISAGYLGERLGAAQSYRRALPKVLTLLLANILYVIVVAIGFVLLVVPGVIFTIWFMLTTTVVMLENHGATGSMGRSRELMRGNLGKGLMLLVLIVILQLVYSGILEYVLDAMPWPSMFWRHFIGNLGQVPILPIQLAPLILLYYDLRIRKEGFDLQQLAAAVESAAQPQPSAEASTPL